MGKRLFGLIWDKRGPSAFGVQEGARRKGGAGHHHCQALQWGQTCVEHLSQGNGPAGLLLSVSSVSPPGGLRVGISSQNFPITTPVPQQQYPAHWVHCRGDANASLAPVGEDTRGAHGPQLPVPTKCIPAGGKTLVCCHWTHPGTALGFGVCSADSTHSKHCLGKL